MAQVSANVWGIVVELDDAETKKVQEGTGNAGAAGPVIATACAAANVAAPICAAVGAIIVAYFEAQSWLISQVNTGCGVYLTLPWVAIYSGQIYAVIPTTRPCSIPLPTLEWSQQSAGQFGTNDPADTIGYQIEHGAVSADVVEFVLVIGPNSSGWDKAVFMPDGEGSEWEIKATGGRGGQAANALWAHQVRNGQQLRFHKPKDLGIWRQVLSLGGLQYLVGGDRCTFTWLRD
ncbi:hypothetical protein [Kibdelosporangium aridum]|uniref:hypothetical protein n=1 Tax=Kibdelosporangium aridum TaxID=2030 RepID=UPI000F7AD4ED|nr:hypothetical protein [Kibdelosporangium aridum]